MTTEEFIRDVCPNHTDTSKWNKSELLHILELYAAQLRKHAVMPRLFFVVEEIEDGVWEQITIGLSTYEEAKAYKDRWDGKHPNAYIVASLNEA